MKKQPSKPEATPTEQSFRHYPQSFGEYVQLHPEILPDYHPFASEVIEVLRNHPDEIPILTATYGIGKSSLLVPALLEEGDKKGFQPLGSISTDVSVDAPSLGLVIFDWYKLNHTGKRRVRHLGSQATSYALDTMPVASRPGQRARPETVARVTKRSKESGEPAIRAILHQRFTEGRDGRPGLFVLDDFVITASKKYTWFTTFIGKLARENDVRLSVTQPVTDDYNAEDDARNIEQQFGKRPKLIEIPEQTVPIAALSELLINYGLDGSDIDAFKQNPLLRRLGVVESLVDIVLAYRDDSLINEDLDDISADDIKTIKDLVDYFGIHGGSDMSFLHSPSGIFSDTTLLENKMRLTPEQLGEMSDALIGPRLK